MPRRRADKIDANQRQIVAELRKLGVSVETGHDDILVGFRGRTWWFEIKGGPTSKLRPYQERLLEQYRGQYHIVWSTDMILDVIGL